MSQSERQQKGRKPFHSNLEEDKQFRKRCEDFNYKLAEIKTKIADVKKTTNSS